MTDEEIQAEEDARAAAYRAQIPVRLAYRRAQLASLDGDPEALTELTAKWQPLIDYIREAKSYGNYPDIEHKPKRPGYLGGWQAVSE